MNGPRSARAIVWQIVQATTIAACALPGILFFVVAADPVSRQLVGNPAARNAWDGITILDYFVMIGLSPLLIPLMWFTHRRARASFAPPAKSALTFVAVCGTLGAAYFWIRLFS